MSFVTPLTNGTVLHGRYRIGQMLGAGGFGITYRATDLVLDRTVALKELYPHALYPVSRSGDDLVVPASREDDHQTRVRRVLKEGQIFTGFRHPHLVRIYEAFVAHNTAYLVMAFLDGESLRSVLNKHGTLASSVVADLLQQIGQGLAYLHDQGVLHLDVKPDNIFVSEEHYVLIDYGEAKAANDGLSVQLSTGGYTPAYMAMEQYAAELEKGPYTDIYALGVTAYECLTGTLPPSCVERQFGKEVNLSAIDAPTLRRRLEHALAVMPKDRPQAVPLWLPAEADVSTYESDAAPVSLPQIPEAKQALFPVRHDGKYGYIDETGDLVIKPQFDEVASFSEGLAGVKYNGKWGYIDKSGRVVIPPQFVWAPDFSDGLAGVKYEGACGYIDTTGHFTIRPQFQYASPFKDGRACVKRDGRYDYIDKTGRFVTHAQFEYADDFREGLAPVARAGEHIGYIDTAGRFVIEPRFDNAGPFSEGLAAVELDNHWGYIDRAGRLVVAPQFDQAERFSEGRARVKRNDQYGYIDKTGRLVIEPQFVYAGDFAEGLAFVRDERGYFGFIDTTGRLVIEPFLDDGGHFRHGLAPVVFQGWDAYIDKTGTLVWRES